MRSRLLVQEDWSSEVGSQALSPTLFPWCTNPGVFGVGDVGTQYGVLSMDQLF
jgi:hypothetical protein